ncbi:hypothetical protein [Actinoplanes sp. NPDC023714]|uniref:hypothetical protein n=1 Tax=Actinoplanes sp. NPDC023714 TaxID=3154322 RepID=UPI0033FF1F52
MLRLSDSGLLKCSVTTSRPAAATVVEAAAVLSAGDFYRAEPAIAVAWPLLMQAGGLGEISGAKRTLTATGRAALGKPAADVLRALWRSRLNKGLIDELSRVENIKAQRTENLMECTYEVVAKVISHDRRLRTLCTPVGERRLAVPLDP